MFKKKCKQQKEKSIWHEVYTLFEVYTQNVAGKVCLSKYEMPISFQASLAISQENFFKILKLQYDSCNYRIP